MPAICTPWVCAGDNSISVRPAARLHRGTGRASIRTSSNSESAVASPETAARQALPALTCSEVPSNSTRSRGYSTVSGGGNEIMKPCRSMPTTEQPKRERRSNSAIFLPWLSAKSGNIQSMTLRFQPACGCNQGAVVEVIFVLVDSIMLCNSTSRWLCQKMSFCRSRRSASTAIRALPSSSQRAVPSVGTTAMSQRKIPAPATSLMPVSTMGVRRAAFAWPLVVTCA